MKKMITNRKIFIPIIFGIILFAACADNNEIPPFPTAETEFKQPITKSFEFSKPDTLVWTTKETNSLNRLLNKKFSWEKLPSKKIDLGLPMPFKANIEKKPFNLESLPYSPFSMDSLIEGRLTINVKELGEPEILEAGELYSKQGATRGVMSATTDLGLPTTARTIFKDCNGMLWIGMDGKIAKFDSHKMQIYGKEQGLTTSSASVLFEDSMGRLWVGNADTISVIDFEADLIYEISSGLQTSAIYGFMEANDGKFWVSRQYSGYDIIDLDEKTIFQFNEENGLLSTFNLTPYQDKNGLIWLSSDGGVNIINLESGKNIKLTSENGLPNQFVTSFYEDKANRLWIGTGLGAMVLDEDRTSSMNYLNSNLFENMEAIASIYQDTSGSIWFGGTNGIMYQFNESEKVLQKFVISSGPSQAILKIIEDKQGQIWAAVAQGGLYKIDPRTGRPGNFTTADGLSSNAVWNTLETIDGKIWIGTYEGIDIYDPATKTVKHLGKVDGLISNSNARLMQDSTGKIWATGSQQGISVIDPNKETIEQLSTDQGIETNAISGIIEAGDGEFWLGGREGELMRVNLDKLTLKYHLPTRAENVFQNNVILKDLNNHIWIAGVGSGIQRIDLTTNERVFLTTEEGLLSNTVFSIALDEKNNIWAATDMGVQFIDVLTNEITNFTKTEGLAANDVYAIGIHKGEAYTGTSRGLTILSPELGTIEQKPIWNVKTIGRAQGLNLLDFSENSFTFDRYDNFWAGVQGEMLTVMDEITKDTIASPTYISGINILDQKQKFYDNEAIWEKRKKLDSSWLKNSDPKQGIGSVRKDSGNLATNSMRWKTVEGTYNMPVELKLPYTQNYLSFNYNGLYYANPDQVYYRYILEGIDKNWSPISKETMSENYRDLPPGDYSFKVASKGFNDVWGEPSSFNFTILPPWWKTWWASLLFLVLIAAIILFIINYRSRWLKKENRVLEERVSHRTEQLKNKIDELKATQSKLIQSEKMASLGELTAGIAHEIQNPLNFVNNFSEVNKELLEELEEEIKNGNYDEVKALAKDVSANEDKIIFHGKRADGIVKGMLQHSRSSTGQKEMTDINTLSDEYLRLAYHGLRAKDKTFNATLNTDFDDSIDKINIVPQDMGRVILNLITNAFYVVKKKKEQNPKGYEPTVSVSTKKQGNMALIKVSDNGNGVPKEVLDKIFQPFFTTKPSGEGTGLGLSLSYDIVKVHDGELTVETKQGEGTTFTISLPIK
ncbi:two-component regulator propeller domain-containing protein [uncultured Maribacter sp.]|uniref:two-component regulator propeller domain-containing protein n=1 Tax=uncultured Maribacter sp. TaxID=431308 RepID=UPI0030D9C1F3|tara:strand:+ start:4875 stop:8582 length:3708 start_codon:yes stop_codon:yes gene_type:complete